MDHRNPLPPEPTTGTAGHTIGWLFLIIFLAVVVAGLMALWGFSSTETLLKVVVTALAVAVTLGITAMAVMRRP